MICSFAEANNRKCFANFGNNPGKELKYDLNDQFYTVTSQISRANFLKIDRFQEFMGNYS